MHGTHNALRMTILCVAGFLLAQVQPAPGDWNPGDTFKMHFPQLPDPEGWDICLVDQWIADDFECTESGPIRDLHFWISWQNDIEAPVDPDTFEVEIFSDAGGMPGTSLWRLAPGTANVVTRPDGMGAQGWHCPVFQWVVPNDHFGIHQINITEIQEPFIQQAGAIYWLVLRAPILMADTDVGWKTSANDPPFPPFGSPARWSTDQMMWPFIETPAMGLLLHDMAFVITDTGGPSDEGEYGDAPEDAIAYPSLGVIGAFPTCRNVPLAGFIRHNNFGAWLGMGFEFETDGNAGQCPIFTNLYDADECFDAPAGLIDGGLLFPEPFTITGPAGSETVVPCPNSVGTPLGPPCSMAMWGTAIDIHVHNTMPNQTLGYVNVLMDWNQDGIWSGSSSCPGAVAVEHVVVDHPIPNGFDGPLSALAPTPFIIGPNGGYVWARFSITERPVGAGWDGSGEFEDGETEDYLLWVDGGPAEEFDWGDLPSPYPTLSANNGPNHLIVSNMALGAGVDSEPDGQPDAGAMGDDNDLLYPPPNDDEDGITFVTTLIPGQQAIIDVTNNTVAPNTGYLKGWIDFNGDGSFAEAGDQVFFGNALAPFPVNFNTYFINVPISATPGPRFARFRISSHPAGFGWTGAAADGEVEDYAVRVEPAMPIMACCLPDGSCVDTTHMDCVLNLLGDPQGPGTDCSTAICHPIKWTQPPIFNPASEHPECFYGWDEPSTYNGFQIVADDWLCLDERPIANIHWWGSYTDWEDLVPPPLAPSRFHIGLWTDRPAGPGGTPPSHPQTMIWEWIVDRGDLNERPVACDFEPGHMQTPDGCYRYDFDIPPDAWFFQEPGPTVYWISISAIYDPVLCACNGDLDGDGSVSAADLAMLQACVGQPPTGQCAGADMDCDGDIDTADVAVFACWFSNCAGPNPDIPACQQLCCPMVVADPEHPWGWKTRPHFYNDDAHAVLNPTQPGLGNEYVEGDVVESGWDMAFVVTTREPEPPLVSKWSQLPHDVNEGFDARSNIGFSAPVDEAKWQQLPNVTLPGVHAHDANILGQYTVITRADQWVCDGGPVTGLVWYGNYELDALGNEKRLSGINHFDVEIYDDNAMPIPFCLPNNSLWVGQPTLAAVNETWTGLLNNEGCRIYRYSYTLPQPFDQQLGQTYWLGIVAISNDANAAAIWRWQNNGPPNPNVCFAASRTVPTSPNWTTDQGTELAFEIIQAGPAPGPDPNRVVADDFISDGRPIEAVRWWGSYLDDRFAPLDPVEPYVIDGWLISFHHAMPDATCPPDAMVGDDPMALGVYFAPAQAVNIVPAGYVDCFGHDVFGYAVDLSQCCLLCAEIDPRDGSIPADPDAFLEVRGSTYWIDVQAVVGVLWTDVSGPACTPIFTGHLPSDLPGSNGHFWGWHTSPGPMAPCQPMNEACVGRISAASVVVPPNDCPEYSGWQKQDWECDSPEQEVQMAFELLTTMPAPCGTCPGDMDGNSIIDGRDIHGFVQCLVDGSLTWLQCACADVDCSKTITVADIDEFVTLLLSGASC